MNLQLEVVNVCAGLKVFSRWKMINPYYFIKYFYDKKELIKQFTKREIISRYRGSYLGVLWSLITPLIMLSVYTFVFSTVFKGRWGQNTPTNEFEFALVMFCGLIVFNIFNETVNRAPGIVVGNVNYVKKVVFPLELLPISVLLSSCVQAGVSFLVLIIANIIFLQTLPWTIIFVPVVVLPLIFLSLGLAWFLASLGVYVRDIGNSVGLITNVLFFLTPVFYPVSSVPAFFQPFMYFNPLTVIVENFRKVVMWGQVPLWIELVPIMIVSYLLMILGLTWFLKTRKGFADVL